MYKVGFPLWRTVARLGVPVGLKVDVHHDDEAGVFIATSHDLEGLVVEATTLEELVQETKGAIEMLLEQHINGSSRTPQTLFNFHEDHAPA